MMIESPESGQSPTPDAVVSALADEHRRAVLRTLDDVGEEGMTLRDLADVVARQVRTESAGETHRHRVRTALHHSHLPKLDECGLVQYDPERKHVQTGDDTLDRELLALLESYDDGPSG